MLNNIMKTKNTELEEQHHIIYVTRHPNGKFYGGRHSTYDLNDGYLGSGTWITEMEDTSCLTREILHKPTDFDTLVKLEEQWIAEHYDDPNCMNISRSSLGWGPGEANIMHDPEVAAKISGDNHWTRQEENEASLEILRKKQNELVEKGEHIFQTDNPNKDGRNAKTAMANGKHINLGDNNPAKQWSRDGTHPWFKQEDGKSIGGITNEKRLEEGTHNWLGPEENKRRVEEGTHNLLGPKSNLDRLANGTHPSQQKKTCEHCFKTASIGMYKRWHGPNCRSNQNA